MENDHGTPVGPRTLSLAADSDLSVAEGDTALFTVTMGRTHGSTVTIPYTITAADNVDVTADDVFDGVSGLGGEVVIPAGSTTGGIPIPIRQDGDDAEYEETFVVTLGRPSPTDFLLTTTTAGKTIRGLPLPVRFLTVSRPDTVDEAGMLSFTIDIGDDEPASDGAVSVTWRIGGSGDRPASAADFDADNDGIADADFPTGNAVIASDSRSVIVRVQVFDDELYEERETYRIDLANPSPGNALSDLVTRTTTTGFIEESDSAVTITADRDYAAEGATASFTVVLSGVSSGSQVAVPFMVTGDNADADDYDIVGSPAQAVTGLVIIAAGATTATIALRITDDTVFEAVRRLRVELGTPLGLRFGAAMSATVSIEDNDGISRPAIRFDRALRQVDEGILAPDGTLIRATIALTATVVRGPGDFSSILTYRWTQNRNFQDSASVGAITQTATSVAAAFTARDVFERRASHFILRATATRNGLEAFAEDQIRIDFFDVEPPVADAGADLEVRENATATLAGTVSDPDDDDRLEPSWSQIAAPDGVVTNFSDATSPRTRASWSGVSTGTVASVTLALTVRDSADLLATDTVTITVRDNTPPRADAGPDLQVLANTVVTLDSGNSLDSRGESATDQLRYSWRQVVADTATAALVSGVALTTPNAAATTWTAPSRARILHFRLAVTDSATLLASSDIVTVTVLGPPLPPIPNPGLTDFFVQSGETLTLNGSASRLPSDDPGSDVTYFWEQVDSNPPTRVISAGDADYAGAITAIAAPAYSAAIVAPQVTVEAFYHVRLTLVATYAGFSSSASRTTSFIVTEAPTQWGARVAPGQQTGSVREVAGGRAHFLMEALNDISIETTLTITWRLGGTATGCPSAAPGCDYGWPEGYTPPDGSDPGSGVLTVAANQRSAAFFVELYDDEVSESSETITVTIIGIASAGDAQQVEHVREAAVRTIAPNDTPVTLGWAQDSLTVMASEEIGMATLTVEVTTPSQVETIHHAGFFIAASTTATGSADSGDYGAFFNRRIGPFGNATRSVSLSIPITSDQNTETTETFNVVLGFVPGQSRPQNVTIFPTTATVVIEPDDASVIGVTIASDRENVAEGMTATFTVTLSRADAGAPVEVPFTVTGDAADYDIASRPAEAVTGLVTIAVGAVTGAIALRIIDDTAFEGAETLRVALDASPVLRRGATRSATVTIAPSDRDVMLAFDPPAYSVAENAGRFEACVAMTAPPPSDPIGETAVLLQVSTIAGSADADDYTELVDVDPGVFDRDTRRRCIDIGIAGDTRVENTETFFLALRLVSSTATDSVTLEPSSATVIISDPAVFSLSVPSGAVEEAPTGAGAPFTVAYTGADLGTTATLTWSLTHTGGAATTSDADWDGALTGTVSFARGVSHGTTRTFNIARAVADNVSEPAETFRVTLGGLAADEGLAGSAISTASVVHTIAASDLLTVSVISGDSVVEGRTGNIRIAFRPLHVRYMGVAELTFTQAGDATPDDYTLNAVTIVPHEVLAGNVLTWQLGVNDDVLLEPHETLTLMLTGVTGTAIHAAIAAPPEDRGTFILQDNEEQTWSVQVAPGTPPGDVVEDGSVSFRIFADSSFGARAPVSIHYRLGGSATGGTADDAGRDYTWPATWDPAANGGSGLGTVMVGEGVSSHTFVIALHDDELDESSETVTVTLTGASSVSTNPVRHDGAVVTRTILDNDAILVSIAVSGEDADADVAGHQVTEASVATFILTLDHASVGTATVPYVIGGDVEAQDYTDRGGGVVTIEPGETTGVLSIDILADADVISSETLTVTLGSSPGLAGSSGPIALTDSLDGRSASVQIVPLERRLTVRRDSDSFLIQESDVNQAVGYTVTLTGGGFSVPTTVTWTITHAQNRGTEDADFLSLTGPVVFGPGDGHGSTRAFIITVVGDDVSEADELYSVNVAVADERADGNTSYGADVINLIVDDDLITIGLDASPPEVSESSGSFSVTVRLSGLSEDEVRVRSGFSGAATGRLVSASLPGGWDYTYANTTVVVPAGHRTTDIVVTLNDDNLNEPDEIILLRIFSPDTSAGGSVMLSADTTRSVTIRDNDPIAASIAPTTQTVSEGGAAAFTVSLSGGAPTSDVVVAYRIAGVDLGDYLDAGGGEFSIAADAVAPHRFTIDIVADRVMESTETMIVTLDGARSAGEANAGGTAQVFITNVVFVPEVPTRWGARVAPGQQTGSVREVAGGRAHFLMEALNDISIETTLTITWRLGGTATGCPSAAPGCDYGWPEGYTPPDGSDPGSGALTVAANQRSAAFFVELYDDEVSESSETITVTIIGIASEGDAQQTDYATEAAVRTIAPNDTLVTLGWSQDSLTVMASEEIGMATLTVEVTTPSQAETIHRAGFFIAASTTATGSADSGDYGAFFNRRIGPFGNATRSVSLSIPITSDQNTETTETFNVVLGFVAGQNRPQNVTIFPTTATVVIEPDDASVIGVTIASDRENVAEGMTATFTVTLSRADAGVPVEVPFMVTGDAADYDIATRPAEAVTGLVTIAAGAVTGAIALRIIDDTVFEGAETLRVALDASPGLRRGATRSATVTIAPSDRDVILAFDPPAYSVAENAGRFEACVAMTAPPPSDPIGETAVLLQVSTITGSADADDYTELVDVDPGVFDRDTRRRCIDIGIAGDTRVENTETFFLALRLVSSTATDSVTLEPSSATVIISDPAVFSLSVPSGAVEEASTGAGAPFTVAYTGADLGTTATLTWSLTHAGGAATTSDADWDGALTGTVSFARGVSHGTTRTFNIARAVADNVSEPAETFRVTLGGLAADEGLAGSAISTASVVHTIAASDLLTVSVISADPVVEGRTGNIRIAFRPLHVRYPGVAQLTFTQAGDATPDDYTLNAVTIVPHEVLAGNVLTWQISASDDLLLEAHETLTLMLTGVTGTAIHAAIAAPPEDRGTFILQDNEEQTWVVQVAPGTPPGEVVEDGSVSFRIFADSSFGARAPVSIHYRLGGSATGGTADDAGRDYTWPATWDPVANGGLGLGTVMVGEGASSHTFVIALHDDELDESSETVTVTLTGASSVPTNPVRHDGAVVTRTILDNDAIRVSIAVSGEDADADVAGHQVTEASVATFILTLDHASVGTATVPYVIGGDVEAQDYTDRGAGVVTIEPGETTGVLSIDILADADVISSETLTVTLGSSPGLAGSSGPIALTDSLDGRSASVQIVPLERRLTVSRDSDSPFIQESNVNQAVGYTVTLTGGGFSVPTTVTWTITHAQNRGTEDADFLSLTGSVVFGPGDGHGSTRAFIITVVGDDVNEADELYSVNVAVADERADGNTSYGADVTDLIIDDDLITIGLDAPPPEVSESSGSFSVTVRLSGLSEDEVRVRSEFSGAATGRLVSASLPGGWDYTYANTTVVVPAGQRTTDIVVTLNDDNLNEPDETIILRIFSPDTSAGGSVMLSADTTRSVTIRDNDPIAASIAPTTQTVSEGGAAAFTVSLSGGEPTSDVVVAYRIAGVDPGDYLDAGGGEFSIAADAVAPHRFTIDIVADRVMESTETMTVTLDSARSAGEADAGGTARVFITDVVAGVGGVMVRIRAFLEGAVIP